MKATVQQTEARTAGSERRGAPYRLEFFVDDDGSGVVLDWLRSLSPTKKRVLGTAMREVLQEHGVAVCGSEFGKALGGGLFEFRVRQKPGAAGPSALGGQLPPERITMRVFCHAYGDRVVLLLGGYDKAAAPTKKRQAKEIALARTRLTRWKARVPS